MTWIIILILTIIIFFLSFAIFYVIKKATYVSKKEKDMIIFAIDIYINYAGELEILSDKHEVIVKELGKLKEKLNGKER